MPRLILVLLSIAALPVMTAAALAQGAGDATGGGFAATTGLSGNRFGSPWGDGVKSGAGGGFGDRVTPGGSTAMEPGAGKPRNMRETRRFRRAA